VKKRACWDKGCDDAPAATAGAFQHVVPPGTFSELGELYAWWHGMLLFVDHPVVGGIAKLESEHQAKWRQHLSPSQCAHFNRIKRVIKALKKRSEEEKKDELDVVEEWEEWFQESRCSVGNLISLLQEKGLVPKQAPRGRTQKST